MIVYTDHLTNVHEAFNATGLSRDGVWLEDHGPMSARKRTRKFIVKLSADRGTDRFGTKRRWANSGQWGAATPQNGYAGEPMGEKAATFDEWGVFIAELFRRDPEAIVGIYNSPDELYAHWTEPTTTNV